MIDFLRGKVTAKDWVAVAVFLGVVAGLVVTFYMMVYQKQNIVITQKEQTNTAIEVDLRKARKIDDEIEQYIRETDEIRNLVKEFEDRLPSKSEIATLIQSFEDMAIAENVKIDTRQQKAFIKGSKEEIPYKIIATGTFHQIAGFINRLERFPRYLKITNLQMTPNEDGVATFKFTLNTYRFLQSTEAGGTK